MTTTPTTPDTDKADLKAMFTPGATMAYVLALVVALLGAFGYSAIMDALKPMAASLGRIEAAVGVKK
jgi:hypothetical protein